MDTSDQPISEMSPGAPLPDMARDFWPDTSWVSNPEWDALHETLLSGGQGTDQSTLFPRSPDVSPPRESLAGTTFSLPVPDAAATQTFDATHSQTIPAPADHGAYVPFQNQFAAHYSVFNTSSSILTSHTGGGTGANGPEEGQCSSNTTTASATSAKRLTWGRFPNQSLAHSIHTTTGVGGGAGP